MTTNLYKNLLTINLLTVFNIYNCSRLSVQSIQSGPVECFSCASYNQPNNSSNSCYFFLFILPNKFGDINLPDSDVNFGPEIEIELPRTCRSNQTLEVEISKISQNNYSKSNSSDPFCNDEIIYESPLLTEKCSFKVDSDFIEKWFHEVGGHNLISLIIKNSTVYDLAESATFSLEYNRTSKSLIRSVYSMIFRKLWKNRLKNQTSL